MASTIVSTDGKSVSMVLDHDTQTTFPGEQHVVSTDFGRWNAYGLQGRASGLRAHKGKGCLPGTLWARGGVDLEPTRPKVSRRVVLYVQYLESTGPTDRHLE